MEILPCLDNEQIVAEKLQRRIDEANDSDMLIQIDENTFFDPKNKAIGFNCSSVLRKQTIADQ